MLPILVGACLAILWAGPAAAQTKVATLAWDPNTDALTAGYEVLVGTAPGVASLTIDVGRATRASLPLPLGGRYYVTVRAYAADGTVGPAASDVVIDLTAPPQRPASLSALVVGSTAQLVWTEPSSGAAPLGYMLSVGTFPGGADLVNFLALGASTSIAGTVPPGQYYARVHAANLMGVGPASDEVSFAIAATTSLSPPVGLAVTWSGSVARLAWSAPSGQAPSSYVVEAGTTPGATDVGAIDVGNTTSFAADLPTGAYYVRVRAAGVAGVSAPSNEIFVRRPTVPPPGRVPAIEAHVQGGVLVLAWDAPTTGGAVDGYVLEAGTAPGLSNVATIALGNTKVFTTPVPLGTYYVRVRATNSGGSGAASSDVVIRR